MDAGQGGALVLAVRLRVEVVEVRAGARLRAHQVAVVVVVGPRRASRVCPALRSCKPDG